MSRGCLILVCCSVSVAFAAGPSAAELSRSIREASLDPDQCYRVRDVRLQKEDIRIYLTDGYLIFSKPVAGERRSAVFTAEVEGGDGEALLMPPTRGERQSLAQFTNSANLDEHFQAALMIFTDGSTSALIDRITKDGSGRKVPDMGPVLAEKWSPVMSNVQNGFQIRMIQDILAPDPKGGMLFMAMSGRRMGNFDMVYDPRAREQIVAGQLNERNGHPAYDVWTSFASQTARREAPKPIDPWYTTSAFRIEATLDPELRMKASTHAHIRIGNRGWRVFAFEVSQAMQVDSVKIDGSPAELFFQDSVRGRALRGSENSAFLVVAPEPLAAGSEHDFEFEHQGAVILRAGNNVFFVGARSNWYPRLSDGFATYDLTFHYPRRLTLVSVGDMVEDRVDGDVRTTHWKTPVKVRMAGFNLGDYEKVSTSAGGYKVDVYGNRRLEAALTPKGVPAGIDLPKLPRYRINTPPQEPTTPITLPDPNARMRTVADDVSSALEFYTSEFGPPALKNLTVAPIPGTFGQGFPGLVYLSTMAYLNPDERPPSMRDTSHQIFFSELIEAHEVAHQWWGCIVTASSYQDEWMTEALSSYSALLFLEKRKGRKAMEQVLDGYRDHLTMKNADGRTIDSAGPITWGGRLESSGIPDAWRAITYEKGAWILHMLRRRMGDDRFLKMLAELRRRYEFRSFSTANFQALAREFLPPGTKPGVIDEFFDNWVYATGIPSLKLHYSVKRAATGVRLTGTVDQTGVDDDFSADVPVEVQFAKGPAQTIWVSTSTDATPFSAALKQTPLKVAIPSIGVLRTR